MDFTKEAIEKIEKMSAPNYKEIGGVIYTDKQMQRVDKPILVKNITVSTLTALVDYLDENNDGLEIDDLIIHIESPKTIKVYSPMDFVHGERQLYITASVDGLYAEFVFDKMMELESFNVMAMNRIDSNDERKRLLALTGKIVSETVNTMADDGITQVVTSKSGVQRLGKETVYNPFRLKPYRTFLEIEQPVSDFNLRISNDGSMAALYTADSGLWKLDAIENIKTFLKLAFDNEIKATIIG